MEEAGLPDMESIQKMLSSGEQENQYLKSRNLALQDQIEGNIMPRQDSNVIEYKLSTEELLERIEHYLKGDILKTQRRADGEIDSFFSPPTKKISVTFYRNNVKGIVYVVDENSNSHINPVQEAEWKVLSILEPGDGDQLLESPVEDNYQQILLQELIKGLESQAKKPKITRLGLASKEIVDPERVNLNEKGVREVMNILSTYINKETFLSYYKEERIYEILGDLGDALNKFFLINSKVIGLDSEYKKTKYPMIIITILHAVESAYRRALMGNENRGTREGIIISQHQGVSQPNLPSVSPPKKRWNPLDRSSW